MDKEKIALTYYLARSFHYVEVRFGRMNRLCKKSEVVMKSAAAKIKNLAIDMAIILALAMGAIALATHGLNTKFPSLF